jgi:amino acid permease
MAWVTSPVQYMIHVDHLACSPTQSMLLAGGLYWTVGAAGYITFGNRTSGDLLRNLGGGRSMVRCYWRGGGAA